MTCNLLRFFEHLLIVGASRIVITVSNFKLLTTIPGLPKKKKEEIKRARTDPSSSARPADVRALIREKDSLVP